MPRSIRLIFSISDLDAEQDLPEAFQDEEAADAGSGGLGDEAAAATETSFPVETSITITKPSGGALTIDAIAQGAWLFPGGSGRASLSTRWEPAQAHVTPYLLTRRPVHDQQHRVLPGRGCRARHDFGRRLEAPGTVHGPGRAFAFPAPLPRATFYSTRKEKALTKLLLRTHSLTTSTRVSSPNSRRTSRSAASTRRSRCSSPTSPNGRSKSAFPDSSPEVLV